MVQNTGKTPRNDTIRPVNLPEPVRVEESPSGKPLVLITAQRQAIIAIEGRWRIDDEWWRAEPVSRLYYNILLASGQRLVLYKDLVGGGWYEQEY